jgi:predicted anti-sigma-YlaC factor YlaD
MGKCERYKPLLMGLIDQELTSEEAADVNQHLNRCSKCRTEYESLRETGARIGAVSFKEPEDEILETLWNPPYSHFTRISGLVMVIAGWVGLILYILYEWIVKSSGNLLPRIGVAVMAMGFVILLVNAIRERLAKYKVDPYKEIIR